MNQTDQKTNWRWWICSMLFIATTINYLDRQVLSLTWEEFIKPEFHWTDGDYGNITAAFSIVYALSMIFAGRFIDFMGSRKGYIWAIGIWSVGACLHAVCGWGTKMILGYESASQMISMTGAAAAAIAGLSTWFFIGARCILAIGESANFPVAIKVTAEYFPKRDRAFATSIFNAGASIGALAAPLTIPLIAKYFQGLGIGNGWEMAFILIGALGFLWMGLWLYVYDAPRESARVNEAELAYIEQDLEAEMESKSSATSSEDEPKMGIFEALKYRQTWAYIMGKFMTDGVWWFFLFWTPAYLTAQFGIKTSEPLGMWLLFTLYAITMLSIYGGKIPTIIINKSGLDPYAARMRAMLIFAFFPLVVLLAQPLGSFSPWFPVILIGIGGAAHQSWSANVYTVVSDMFPKSAVATVTGIGGMAGGVSSFILNKSAGMLFDHAEATNLEFMGFAGKPAGYSILFCYCAVAYLLGWIIMKSLVPRYEIIRR